MTRKIIIDIETDGLKSTKIWCVVCKELNTGEALHFLDKPSLLSYLQADDVFIAHNGIGFDSTVR